MDKKPAYVARIPLRWRDLDDFGHVNGSVYFTFFEEARVRWLESLGISLKNMTEGPVLLTAKCLYIKQIFYPATLLVKVIASEPGRSSFLVSHEIELEEDPGVVYAKASTKIVWVNYKAEKSVPFPDEIRKLIVADVG